VNIPFSDDEIFDLVKKSFDNISKDYPSLTYKYPSIKKSLVSLMHMYTGTNGYFNPITGEAQINYKVPRNGLPYITCHEVAHQLGWSAENDANFIGFLTSSQSQNIYFRYSGYRMAFGYIIRELSKRDENLEEQLWQKVNPGIIEDYKNSRKVWDAYENPIEPYIKKGYSSYLKANNQAGGIASYSYVVDLLIAYDKKHSI